MVYSEATGWHPGGQISCPNAACDETPLENPGISGDPVSDCQIKGFPANLVYKNAKNYTSLKGDELEQKTASCIQHGGQIWFGISYYSGEGIGGVGGIGHYDPKTQKMKIRRPKLLRSTSVHHVAHDGRSLWLGTAGFYECIGDAPTQGLLRYEWTNGRIESFKGKSDGPCGFVVNDLLWRNGQLWVATELGLAKWDAKNNSWTNYVPDPNSNPPMRETSCEELYVASLDKLKRNMGEYEHLDLESPYSLFNDTLKAFRPEFYKKYHTNSH